MIYTMNTNVKKTTDTKICKLERGYMIGGTCNRNTALCTIGLVLVHRAAKTQ